jgi:hypothetical protein
MLFQEIVKLFALKVKIGTNYFFGSIESSFPIDPPMSMLLHAAKTALFCAPASFFGHELIFICEAGVFGVCDALFN